jgi:hypothetical protein
MTEPWTCTQANQDGFTPLRHFQKFAAKRTAKEFLNSYPIPALLVIDRSAKSPGVLDFLGPEKSGFQLVTQSIEGTEILRYLGKVAFVTKRPGNPYPHLISVGRSKKNDITIAVDSVSRVHGYFVAENDGWSFTDHGSSNGSYLNGEQLEPGQKVSLEDHSTLRLGLEALLEFLSPAALYQHARSS